MPTIRILDHHVLYDNPIPHLVSRHGYFPHIVKLSADELLSFHMQGQAFEAADSTMHISRSTDQGRTWTAEGPLCEAPKDGVMSMLCLKPTLLDDGNLVAVGYAWYRDHHEQELTNPETGGLLPGDNLVSFSSDRGRNWMKPAPMKLSCPEMLEISGPCIQISNGDLLASGPPMPMWDGTKPSGAHGILVRSGDRGATWEEFAIYSELPEDRASPVESRLCEMQPGRIAALAWALDEGTGEHLPNHITVSEDYGKTWSDPINTGVRGQASNLMHLGGDRLLTIHCHREDEPYGLFVRVIDFTGNRWKTVTEERIWEPEAARRTTGYGDMRNLKFGQPSLLSLDNGEILATHWAVENGQGKILIHRIRVA